jgi:hypothetical protein
MKKNRDSRINHVRAVSYAFFLKEQAEDKAVIKNKKIYGKQKMVTMQCKLERNSVT